MVCTYISPKIKDISFLRRSGDMGKIILEEFPEVAEQYRIGKTIKQIAEQYQLQKRFRAKRSVVEKAVSFALRGFPYNLRQLESYKGLIPLGEMDEIRDKNRLVGSFKGGRFASSKRTIPWKNWVMGNTYCVYSEAQYAYDLSLLPKYRKIKNIDRKKLTERLNGLYHNGEDVRTPNAVSSLLNRMKS